MIKQLVASAAKRSLKLAHFSVLFYQYNFYFRQLTYLSPLKL